MKKFEYMVEDMSIVEDVEQLDDLGEDGWELICGSELYGKLIFKRCLCNEETPETIVRNVTPNAPAVSYTGEYDYEDGNIRLKFKGHEETNNLFFGEGVGFKFLIENKTTNSYRISAKDVSVNGFVVSSSELITSKLGAFKKAIDEMYLFFNKNNLNDCDIYSIDDVEELSFVLEVEDETTNKSYDSEEVFIGLLDIPF